MNQRSTPWQSYRQVTTQTATPEHLVLMLYDGAVNYLERSLAGFDYSDPLQFNLTINNNILNAQAIIYDMNSRLDLDKGGEIAVTLRRLYNYFYNRLQDANIKKQKPPIEEVLRHLRGLRDAWAQMLRRGTGDDSAVSATEPDLRLA